MVGSPRQRRAPWDQSDGRLAAAPPHPTGREPAL